MQLTLDEKHALLARLAAQQNPAYDPARDITIEDLIAQLGPGGTRNMAERLLKRAVAAGELTEGYAVRGGRQIRVYRPAETQP